MRKHFTLLAVAVVALCAFSAVASAESLTVKEFDRLASNTGTFWSGDSQHGSVGTTAMQIELRDAEGDVINGDELFVGFCVDPVQPIHQNEDVDVAMTNIENVTGGLEAAWLFDTVYTEDLSTKQIAGLQYAIWEVTSGDETYDLSYGAGNFYAWITDASIRNYANEYLALVASQGDISSDDLSATYLISQTPTHQDLIVRIPNTDPAVPTPEPASMLLLGIGLLGLFGLSRKQKH